MKRSPSARVGLLHPGQMGSSIGAAAIAAGQQVYWCNDGRSAQTRARAEADALQPLASLEQLVDRCEMILSVCPPAAAESLAQQVMSAGFRGLYCDANAVSPETTRRIEACVADAGAAFVDGGIVGPPARHRGHTILYLSGVRTGEVASLFVGSKLETHVVGPAAGQASAVKMAFAAYTKGSSALLLAARALAEQQGVSDGLLHAWRALSPELSARCDATAAHIAPKAWRFEGEMREISRTFEEAGLPGGFHTAAAELYSRLADLKDHQAPSIEDVLTALLHDS